MHFGQRMATAEQLGAFLDAKVIPVSELQLGDEVWMRKVRESVKTKAPKPLLDLHVTARFRVQTDGKRAVAGRRKECAEPRW